MEFKQLQSFASVVKYNSFTKAADSLYLSQPTISAHIRQLEEELNVRLVLRTTKSVEITPKGMELYGYIQTILGLHSRILECCAADSTKMIHLGASTIPSAYILPEVLPPYGEMNPQVYFEIQQSDSEGVISGLLDGVFDIGLVGMRGEEERLTYVPFFQDKLVIITPVNDRFLAMSQMPRPPIKELLQEPIILREQGSGSKKRADYILESMGISQRDLRVTARVNDQETIKNLVAGGLGISIISERAAHNFLKEKRILMFDFPADNNKRDLYIAYRKNYILKDYIQDFLRYIKQYYDNCGEPRSGSAPLRVSTDA